MEIVNLLNLHSIVICYLCICGKVQVVYGEDGSHEIFSSLSQVKFLWHTEIKTVAWMERFIENVDNIPKQLSAYIIDHYKLHLNQTPNYEYLGHPLNAYHLIQHVASGWQNIIQNELTDGPTKLIIDQFEKLIDRRKYILPDKQDVDGAASGIVRLCNEYRLDVKELIRNGKLVTTAAYGKKVESLPSVRKLSALDLYYMATQAAKHELYYDSVLLYQHLVKQTKKEETLKSIRHYNAWNLTITSRKAKSLLTKAKQLHDRKLIQKGHSGIFHTCNHKPFNSKRKIKKFKIWPANMSVLLGRESYNAYSKHKETFGKIFENEEAFFKTTKNQIRKLCNGGQLWTSRQRENLRCYFSCDESYWLKLGPFKINVNSYDPFHFSIKNLLYDHECDELTNRVGPRLRKWTGKKSKVHEHLEWSGLRVMKNMVVAEEKTVIYKKLNRRISHLTGLKTNSSRNESEHLMISNYGIGGFYVPHVDHTPTPQNNGGDRLATMLNILEAPKAGGATIVPYAGISVFSEKGDGILWYNLLRNELVDKYTTHSACPVLLGNKWIGNKWISYNAQWNVFPCDLSLSSRISIKQA